MPAQRRRPTRKTLCPDLSNVRLVTDSATIVTDALGFWCKRLTELACPDCGSVGTLHLQHEAFGVVVTCSRTESLHDPCQHEEELHFRKRAK